MGFPPQLSMHHESEGGHQRANGGVDMTIVAFPRHRL